MNYKQPAKWVSSNWFYVLVSLLTLETFVVAQSVYDVLASNQVFLAVRQVTNQRLLEIILVFNLLPVLVLFLLWAACRRLHAGLSRALLSVVYFVLFFAFFLQTHNAYLSGWQPFPHSYLLWIVPSALLVFISLRVEKPFRSFVLVLSPVVLIFPVLFLNRTWTEPKTLLPQGSEATQALVSSETKKNFPPIYMLVLDELALHALLDDSGQIDGARFPNFKKLASESYWFRNATANADYSHRSIPVILTGNFHIGEDPSYEVYPNNLFTLLQPYYDIYIHEVVTHFCEPTRFHCPDAEITSSNIELLRDILYLYAFQVLPKNLNLGLPDFTSSWGPFRSVRDDLTARIDRFQRFVDSLGSEANEHTFHFFHHLLPHGPYALSSEGFIYDRSWHIASFVRANPQPLKRKTIDQLVATARAAGNASLLETLRDSYLEQITYVDKEVGRFVDRLKQIGLYDKSLIIITSDHGVSFRRDFPGRDLCQANADVILTVPLFIKVPFQERAEVSEKDVQHIDIVPTVADLLSIEIPWELAGRSAFDPSTPKRHKVAYIMPGHGFEFSESLGLAQVGVQAEGPGSSLIGQRIEAYNPYGDKSVRGALDTLAVSELRHVSYDVEFPIYVHGWAALPDNSTIPREVAVAVNGEIVAVTTPSCGRPDVAKAYRNPGILASGWIASFSVRKLREGANVVTAYVVMDDKNKRLAQLGASRGNTIYKAMSAVSGIFALIGKRVETLDVQDDSTVRGSLDAVSEPQFIMREGEESPIGVRGWAALLDKSGVPEHVAVAVNGEIVAITSPSSPRPDVVKSYQNRDFLLSGWSTTFSSQKLKEGENVVTAYVVLDADASKLAVLGTINNKIQVVRE